MKMSMNPQNTNTDIPSKYYRVNHNLIVTFVNNNTDTEAVHM